MASFVSGNNARQRVNSLFSDSPDSGSFGPIGHISPVSADRLKGFIGYVGGSGEGQTGRINPIENTEHAAFIGDVVREGIERLGITGATRLSLRTVVRNSALNDLSREVAGAGATIEAEMPPNQDYSIVYIGYNAPQRTLSAERRHEHSETIRDAIVEHGYGRRSLTAFLEDLRANANDYSTRIIDDSGRNFSSAELGSAYNLLATFGYDSEEARAILHDDNNIIGFVYENSGTSRRLVGISITERKDIPLSTGETIHMAEITDGTVLRNAGGRSLYSMLLQDVFRHMALNRRDISLIYAESNISSDPLLKAAALQGREFSGILPYHAAIMNRDTNQLELESFVVTYLTRAQLIGSVVKVDDALTAQLQQAIRA